jgi:hypothetical protein
MEGFVCEVKVKMYMACVMPYTPLWEGMHSLLDLEWDLLSFDAKSWTRSLTAANPILKSSPLWQLALIFVFFQFLR